MGLPEQSGLKGKAKATAKVTQEEQRGTTSPGPHNGRPGPGKVSPDPPLTCVHHCGQD